MEEIKQKTGSVNDILNMMNRASEVFSYEIFIPSLNRNIMFREMNTSQQKRLLKAIIDSPAYNTEFIFTLRQIFEENCTEKIEIDKLTIFDKMVIAMTMRSVSINNDLDLEFTLPVSKKKIVRRIDLKDLVNKAVKDVTIKPATIKDDKGAFQVDCYLPTIGEEFSLENELRRDVTTIEIKDEKQLRNTVGEVFSNELVKYIKKITIKSGGDEMAEVDMSTLKFKDRIRMVEKLPTAVLKHIIRYMTEVTKEVNKLVLIKDEIDGETVEQRIKLDASFFTVS